LVRAVSHFSATKSTGPFGDEVDGRKKENPLGTEALPGIHFVTPLNHQASFGFGVTIPYGFATEYSADSVARYIATKSELFAVNLNPSIAFKLDPHWSIGVGVSAQNLRAELNQQIDSMFFLGMAPDQRYDSTIKNKGDSWGYGANAGVLFELDSNTRFGFSYRSQVFHRLSGKATVTYNQDLLQLLPGAKDLMIMNGIYDNHISARITMPAMAIVSGYHRFNQKWAVMGSATYTGWHVFKQLMLHFTDPNPQGGSKTPDALTVERFRDTMKYALGVNYYFTDRTMGRMGVAYDLTPVRKNYRTVRLPDGNRTWINLGLHQQLTRHFSADVGYAHIFIRNTSVDQVVAPDPTQPFLNYEVAGSYKHNYADLFGLQVNYQFG